RQHPLRFAQCVTKQHGCNCALAICTPPAHDLLNDLWRGGPAVDRQGKRGFAHEYLALHRLARRTSGVRLALVISGNNPDLSRMLDSDLRRAQNVPGRMEGNGHAAEWKRRAIVDGGDFMARPQPMRGNAQARTCENVACASMA